MANRNDAHPEDAFVENNDDLDGDSNLINESFGINNGGVANDEAGSDNFGSQHQRSLVGYSFRPRPISTFHTESTSNGQTQYRDGAPFASSVEQQQGLRTAVNELDRLKQEAAEKQSRVLEKKAYFASQLAPPSNIIEATSLQVARHKVRGIREEHFAVIAKTTVFGEHTTQKQRKMLEMQSQFDVFTSVVQKLVTFMKKYEGRCKAIYEEFDENRQMLNKMTISEEKQFIGCKEMSDSFNINNQKLLEKQQVVVEELANRVACTKHLNVELAEMDAEEREIVNLIKQQESEAENLERLRQSYVDFTHLEIINNYDKSLADGMQTLRDAFQQARNAAASVLAEQDQLVIQLRHVREVESELRATARNLATQHETSSSQMPAKTADIEKRIEREAQTLLALRKNLADQKSRAELRRKMFEQDFMVMQKRKEMEALQKRQQQEEEDRLLKQQQQQQQLLLFEKGLEKSRTNASRVLATFCASPGANTPAAATSPRKSQAQASSFHSPPPLPMAVVCASSPNRASPGKLKATASFKRPKSPSQASSPTIHKRLSLRATVHSPVPRMPAGQSLDNHQFKVPLPPPPPRMCTTPPPPKRASDLSLAGSQSTAVSTTSTSFLDLDDVPSFDFDATVRDTLRTGVTTAENASERKNVKGGANTARARQDRSDASTVSQFSLSKLM